MNALTGSACYDDPARLQEYERHRAWALNPNLVMEEPAVRRALGDVTGLRVLDAGCGDGTHARSLLDAGAAHVTAFDGSTAMVDRARAVLAGRDAQVSHGALEDFEAAGPDVDLVVARLCLHRVADADDALRRLASALVPGGRLLLTVVHPLLTAPLAPGPGARRQAWTVDDYFSPGPREREWLGGRVTWHHRTVEQWVRAVLGVGTLTSLSECEPAPELFAGAPDELRRRRRVPAILLLAGRTDPGAGPAGPTDRARVR